MSYTYIYLYIYRYWRWEESGWVRGNKGTLFSSHGAKKLRRCVFAARPRSARRKNGHYCPNVSCRVYWFFSLLSNSGGGGGGGQGAGGRGMERFRLREVDKDGGARAGGVVGSGGSICNYLFDCRPLISLSSVTLRFTTGNLLAGWLLSSAVSARRFNRLITLIRLIGSPPVRAAATTTTTSLPDILIPFPLNYLYSFILVLAI